MLKLIKHGTREGCLEWSRKNIGCYVPVDVSTHPLFPRYFPRLSTATQTWADMNAIGEVMAPELITKPKDSSDTVAPSLVFPSDH